MNNRDFIWFVAWKKHIWRSSVDNVWRYIMGFIDIWAWVLLGFNLKHVYSVRFHWLLCRLFGYEIMQDWCLIAESNHYIDQYLACYKLRTDFTMVYYLSVDKEGHQTNRHWSIFFLFFLSLNTKREHVETSVWQSLILYIGLVFKCR